MTEVERRIETARREENSKLDLSNLSIDTLPDTLWDLKWLQELRAEGCGLVEISQNIGKLKKLKSISFCQNKITSLPETIGQLNSLQMLDFSDNALTALPESVGRLAKLQKIEISNNQIKCLPSSVGLLSGLQSLDLSHNELAGLPDSMGDLDRLQTLLLPHNKLVSIPESVGRLRSLQRLDISDNQLRILPESLGQMHSLQLLFISNNQISSLPETVGGLADLLELSLDGNNLSALPEPLGKLTQLTGLFLHGNSALGLTDELLGPRIQEVYEGNKNPARASDILAFYFKSLEGVRPLNEVKMLLVGRGDAGKSSIRDCLLNFGFDPQKKETPGIQIDTWPLKQGRETVRLHVWDFAGQELTHGTHQFFLTERSVYILVLDARADTQDRDAEYWLQLISAFGGDSPVIVALNKWKTKPFNVDRFGIQERYPSVRAFVETDCSTGHGLDLLEQEVRNTVASLEAVREPFPLAWFKTKNVFSEMKTNYVSFETFRKECERNGVKKDIEQESLARILHRLGIVLHYADDPRLRDTTVLKPHWVTESIYKLLRLKEGPTSDGSVTVAEAGKALPKESPEMVRYLIGLMRRFELCFPMDETEERWLVPELLPRYQPKLGNEWQAIHSLKLRYKYKVLPEGLIPRFITRTYPLSVNQVRWRGGVVLEMDGAKALVRHNIGASQVDVIILGVDEATQRLAKLIRNHFAHIHADHLRGLGPEELVEMMGHPDKFKSVAILEADEQQKRTTTVDTKSGSVVVSQTVQLNRISTPESRDPKQRRQRLFLSYSHKDAGLRDVFQENLALLEQDGLLTWWFDGKIIPSTEWDKEIRSELEQADIIVFLISTNFLNSSYIQGVEMERALDRRRLEQAELVSVLLEDCSWEDRKFAKYQIIRPGDRPVRNWSRHRSAFNEVEKQLRTVIKRVLGKNALSKR